MVMRSIASKMENASDSCSKPLLAALYSVPEVVEAVPMRLFERCAHARKLSGLSQEALALELGVSRGAVAQWEMRNGTAPTVENMGALARRTGVFFEWLGTGIGPVVHRPPGVAEEPLTYLPLTAQEELLLQLFRQASKPKRAAVIDLLK